MKTKEFIEKVEGLESYSVVIDRGYAKICNRRKDINFAEVSMHQTNYLEVSSFNYKLIKLCLEYAETPIVEREEVKKYTVVLPDPERAATIIALAKIEKFIIIGVEEIGHPLPNNYHLTEAEIKRNHEYLWQFAKEVEAE